MEVDEVRPGTWLVRRARVAIGFPDHDEALRVGEWNRPEQHAVDDAEDGRGHTDAQRQRQDGGGGKAGTAPEQTDGIAKVLEHG